jgi:hypothetical protein
MEEESSEQKIIAIGSLIPHYMQLIRNDITDSKDRHMSSSLQDPRMKVRCNKIFHTLEFEEFYLHQFAKSYSSQAPQSID